MSRNQREGRYCGKVGARHRRARHWTFWLIANRIWARRTATPSASVQADGSGEGGAA